MSRSHRSSWRWWRLLLTILSAGLLASVLTGTSGKASAVPTIAMAPSAVNGQGSSYVALAMQQWVADAQTRGLRVNYLPTGSPPGLTAFGQNLVDFAATEAEFSSLQGTDPARGYQYVPSTAGAVAVMYNVQDAAGRKVDYLQLSRRTVARIFTGEITRWSDPSITADNKGIALPDQPITVIYRTGQSGTTALFYDFVQNTAPDVFGPWAARNKLPTSVRIIELPPGFAPSAQGFGGSDQIAQHIASPAGLWSIGYDEFGYSKVYNAPSAYIQNAAGQWILPYSANISAALESARLRPDLSQELSGVYNSTNPAAYPISAYSYLVTQCAPSGDRPTCRGNYTNPGISEALAQWMRYIACDGQIAMSDLGYSPLPPNLSQEVANSIGRMSGTPPETLTADNCANPRFRGDVGAASPPAPVEQRAEGGDTGPIDGAAADAAAGPGAVSGGDEVAVAEEAAAGRAGATRSAGGGSGQWRDPAPAAYDRPGIEFSVVLPLVVLLAALIAPPLLGGRLRRSRSG